MLLRLRTCVSLAVLASFLILTSCDSQHEDVSSTVQTYNEDISSTVKTNNKVIKEAWNHLVRSDLRHSDFSRRSSTFQLLNGKLVVFDIKDNKVRSESDEVIVSRFAVVAVSQTADDRIRILDATFVHGWPGRDPADIVPFAVSDDERIFRQ